MKKNIQKLLRNYQKLTPRERVVFKNVLNRQNEIENLRQMEERALIAQTIQQSIHDDEGRPYFNVDWIAKNIMKLTDKEIEQNRNRISNKFGNKLEDLPE